MLDLNLAAVEGLMPDRTILLEIGVDGAARAHGGRPRPDRARGRWLSRACRRRVPAAGRSGFRRATSWLDGSLPEKELAEQIAAAIQAATERVSELGGDPFAAVPEQLEAKSLLTAALADGGAHAFLFHGPAGVGKTAAAFAFAGVQLGDARRVEERTHPDLRVIEPLGDMIRVAAI